MIKYAKFEHVSMRQHGVEKHSEPDPQLLDNNLQKVPDATNSCEKKIAHFDMIIKHDIPVP